jgi:hypothetical protein
MIRIEFPLITRVVGGEQRSPTQQQQQNYMLCRGKLMIKHAEIHNMEYGLLHPLPRLQRMHMCLTPPTNLNH